MSSDRSGGSESLEQLQDEERRVSKRRTRLHERIRYLQTMGDGTGKPATREQLDELARQERELSKEREDLHVKIDERRKQRRTY